MSSDYSDLNARPIANRFFRPERTPATNLFRGSRVTIELEGQEYPSYDLAMNGVSFLSPPGRFSPDDPRELSTRVLVSGHVGYEGKAQVVRRESHGRRDLVALTLLTDFLDIPTLQESAREHELELALAQGPERIHERIPLAFRQVVERYAHFLSYYKRLLDDQESALSASGKATPNAILDLARRAADSMRPRWNRMREEASSVAEECILDPQTLKLARRYTETMLDAYALPCPIYYHSHHKPLGYPGDYRVMLQIYNDQFEGNTVFAKAFHKVSVEEPLAVGVRTRKDLLVEILESELDRLDSLSPTRTLRLTSLACGPAREVTELIDRGRTWVSPVEWTLVDQEEAVLSLAWQEIRRAVAQRDAPVKALCMYRSFGQMLRDTNHQSLESLQDVIYTAGLMDYLPDATARGLISSFYDRLAPGGLLLLGNATRENRTFVLEFICDWTLLYRDPAEMRALASDIKGAELSVATERTGCYHFLVVRRPLA